MSDRSALPHLYLASQSPRRRQLLETLGLSFTAIASDAPEDHPNAANVATVTVSNAVAKGHAIQPRVKNESDVIVAADTLVVFGDQVISKPVDAAEVIRTLTALSGKRHLVVTGMALLSTRFGCQTSATETWIQFRDLSKQEIVDYASTKEPYDKAGSYAIQGLGSLFIAKMDGSYTNAMGLPVESLLRQLGEFTAIPTYRWF